MGQSTNDYYGLVKVGNKKVGDCCAVLNMRPATGCVGFELGLCQVCRVAGDVTRQWPCYAYGDERRRSGVLAYRQRQERAWEKTPEAFLYTLRAIQSERPWVMECRWNEGGELRSQAEVFRLFHLAESVPSMLFFGYSCRSDLLWGGRPRNLILNGSGWKRGRMNNYKVVLRPSGEHPVCPGNCRRCDLCKVERGLTIETVLRRPGGRRKEVNNGGKALGR